MMRMKMERLPERARRSSREKEHMMRKPGPSSSMRHELSRSGMRKFSPPAMKREPIASKRRHSPVMHPRSPPPDHRLVNRPMHGSPEPIDRARNMKRPPFEKRKMSPSPVRPQMQRSSPFRDERYLSSTRIMHSPHHSPPPHKKKISRSIEGYHSKSPDRRHHPEVSRHPTVQVSHRPSSSVPSAVHRNNHTEVHRPMQDSRLPNRSRSRSPFASSSVSKRPPPVDSHYDTYRYSSPGPVKPTVTTSKKNYGLTLHERFTYVVETTRTEPRIKYTRDDLEKITIDVHRHIKPPSPTLRHIVNPNDVKLVRRVDEGHRPIFDRDEIKQATRDLREDAYYEKKTSSTSYGSSRPVNFRDVENYEITRHRLNPVSQPSPSGKSLNDRWQSIEAKPAPVSRNERSRDYDPPKAKSSYSPVNRPKSQDRDFRSERYPKAPARSNYPEKQRMPSHSPPRRSAPVHHKEGERDYYDTRRKSPIRKVRSRSPVTRDHMNSRSHPPPPEKRYPENNSKRVDKYRERRSPSHELSSNWPPKERSDTRSERRPDKYSDKPGYPPSRSSYHEGKAFKSSESSRGSRGFRSPRGFRSRGFRGGFRGAPRGSFPTRRPSRGGYRGTSSSRGRGAPSRSRTSPYVWVHDMYSHSPENR